ncbi:type II toxin-antitoxin system VapC family toxin [Phreatobacter oligotrophus]|jgi:predicted nucleic acid-binding protein|uniref:Ribonuclease VapC n=1 Tax=Phreatobacter oligotrophus TaxID=1122261 RepID=A0A2T4YZE6_9HYPH|nr:type II toxin-antitoxin system VapC family toxin [Phreatobacter oligotrophus]PTM52310.1 putative nucleic acid-binding protein [Phreatobacter oligotrophus]
MTPIVLDASCMLAAFLPDEMIGGAADIVEAALTAGTIVPAIWRLEVVNGMLQAHRRGRFDADVLQTLLGEFAKIVVTIDPDGASAPWGRVADLARRHHLSAYDASYLELARRRGLPLATLDTKLRRAAGQESVEVF